MIDIARETLVLWREGISPSLSLLIPTFAFPEAPHRITAMILRRWNAPLPIPVNNCYPASSVSVLIPDYYPCADPRLVSCYALFE